MNSCRPSFLAFLIAMAAPGVLPLKVSAQDRPEEQSAIALTDADKASLAALDAAIKRFDALHSKVEDVHEKASVKAFLDGLKNRQYALRKNFDQALFDTLRLDVEIEYQRLIAWMADPIPTRENRRDIEFPAAVSTRVGKIVPNELTREEKAAGWELLFDGRTFKGWRGYRLKGMPVVGWEIKDGKMHHIGVDKALKVPFEILRSGEIITERKFNDFELAWDWKVGPRGNSGIKYLVTEDRPSAPGPEYQMTDDAGPFDPRRDRLHATAAFYAIFPPTENRVKPAGEWNTSRILVRGNHVEHWLNGAMVMSCMLGSPEMKAGVAKTKFKDEPGFGEKIAGHIMLTAHGDEYWIQNIKVRELK